MIPEEVQVYLRLVEALDGDPSGPISRFHEDPLSRLKVLGAARAAFPGYDDPTVPDEVVEDYLRRFLAFANAEAERGRYLADMLATYGPVLPVFQDDLFALWLNRGRALGRLTHSVLAGVRYALGSNVPDEVLDAVSDTDAERDERAYQNRKSARAAALSSGGLPF